MIFAFDLPITPVRAMALRRARPAERDKLGFSPLAAERVWAWDPKKKTLQVFVKPDSYSERDYLRFRKNNEKVSDANLWEIVTNGGTNSKFIRQYVDDAELFKGLEWFKLTDD